jgi:hypothetical protein
MYVRAVGGMLASFSTTNTLLEPSIDGGTMQRTMVSINTFR